jgi:hypothetical protein
MGSCSADRELQFEEEFTAGIYEVKHSRIYEYLSWNSSSKKEAP